MTDAIQFCCLVGGVCALCGGTWKVAGDGWALVVFGLLLLSSVVYARTRGSDDRQPDEFADS